MANKKRIDFDALKSCDIRTYSELSSRKCARVKMFLYRYFFQIRADHPNINEDIKDILANHRNPATAVSVHKIRAAYKARKGVEFPIKGHLGFGAFALSIPFVAVFSSRRGTYLYYRILTSHTTIIWYNVHVVHISRFMAMYCKGKSGRICTNNSTNTLSLN
uniref:Uncharacterized protein n=1 Tax=Glossina austeni TaxID=7395 RepID=A0A1A9VJ82_GLOAU